MNARSTVLSCSEKSDAEKSRVRGRVRRAERVIGDRVSAVVRARLVEVLKLEHKSRNDFRAQVTEDALDEVCVTEDTVVKQGLVQRHVCWIQYSGCSLVSAQVGEGGKAEVGDTEDPTMLLRATQGSVGGAVHEAVRWPGMRNRRLNRPELYSTMYSVLCSNGMEKTFW